MDDPGKFDNPPEIIGLDDDTGLANKSRHVVIEMKANESMQCLEKAIQRFDRQRELNDIYGKNGVKD